MRKTSPIVAARQEARTAALREAIAARRARLEAAMPDHLTTPKVDEDIRHLSIYMTDAAVDRIVFLITAAREG